jgi:hypothetical protein
MARPALLYANTDQGNRDEEAGNGRSDLWGIRRRSLRGAKTGTQGAKTGTQRFNLDKMRDLANSDSEEIGFLGLLPSLKAPKLKCYIPVLASPLRCLYPIESGSLVKTVISVETEIAVENDLMRQ